MTRSGWIRGAGALALVIGLAVAGVRISAAMGTGGERAPDVAVQLLDGRVLSLSELRGQVVLVNFWATWCPPCRLEMPGFQRVYEARRDDGFTIVGLSTDIVSDDQIRFFLEQRGIGYPVGRATRYAAEAFGGANTLPTSILVDAEGRIRGRVTGVYDERRLVAEVDALLREAGREPTGVVAAAERSVPGFLDLEGVGHGLGSAEAPVTVVEFSDYGCAYCSRFARATFPRLYREFIEPGRVKWLHVPYVLGKFPNSEEAVLAAACAGEQGGERFWATHMTLFTRQPEWRELADPASVFRGYVEAAGGDGETFTRCYEERRPLGGLARADEVALAAGVSSTPTFFVNGRRVEGAVPLEQFRQEVLAAERE